MPIAVNRPVTVLGAKSGTFILGITQKRISKYASADSYCKTFRLNFGMFIFKVAEFAIP